MLAWFAEEDGKAGGNVISNDPSDVSTQEAQGARAISMSLTTFHVLKSSNGFNKFFNWSHGCDGQPLEWFFYSKSDTCGASYLDTQYVVHSVHPFGSQVFGLLPASLQ